MRVSPRAADPDDALASGGPAVSAGAVGVGWRGGALATTRPRFAGGEVPGTPSLPPPLDRMLTGLCVAVLPSAPSPPGARSRALLPSEPSLLDARWLGSGRGTGTDERLPLPPLDEPPSALPCGPSANPRPNSRAADTIVRTAAPAAPPVAVTPRWLPVLAARPATPPLAAGPPMRSPTKSTSSHNSHGHNTSNRHKARPCTTSTTCSTGSSPASRGNSSAWDRSITATMKNGAHAIAVPRAAHFHTHPEVA